MVAAALRSGAAQARCVFEVFTRHLPPRRRYGVVAGTGRLLDAIERFRFGPDELDDLCAHRVIDPRNGGLARRLPLRRRHRRRCRGRGLLPGHARPVRHGHLRRVRPARNARPVRAQPRQRDRLRRRPDGGGRREPSGHRDGLAAHARAGRRRARHAPRTSPASPARPTWRPDAATGCRPPGPPRTPSSWPTASEREAFEAQVACLGPGTTLLVDTFDVAARRPHRGGGGRFGAGRRPHRLRGSRRAWRSRSGPSWTRSGRSPPGSW